jgi:hypothetical protein
VTRRALFLCFGLSAVLAVPALATSGGSVDVLHAFKKQIPFVKRHTTVPVLLPGTLPFGGKVPKVYATGFASKNRWGLELAGAANCGGADACFLASFDGRRGGRLPGKSNLRLAGGQPAFYKGITCGASCSPATLWFLHRGVLYTWQHKDPPKDAKAVLAGLAAKAIAAGPR